MGIIDTLSAGFNAVTRRLWLAIIPVILDLFLWLGPKLSIQPVLDKTLRLFRMMMEATPVPGTSGSEATEMVELMLETLQETVGRMNLFALLAWGRLGVPSVAGTSLIPEDARWVIQLSEYWQVFLLQMLLLAVGLLIACVFLGLLAQQMRRGETDLPGLALRVPRYWLHMAAIFVPLSFLFVLAVSAGMLLGPLSIFIGVGILWLMLYISFVPQAITLAEHKPLIALWSSFTVVRFNFWSTLGLIILTNVISAGLGLIWNRLLLGSSVGTIVAILGNAYIGTGLTLSLFIFYRDRVTRLRQMVEQQQQRSA